MILSILDPDPDPLIRDPDFSSIIKQNINFVGPTAAAVLTIQCPEARP